MIAPAKATKTKEPMTQLADLRSRFAAEELQALLRWRQLVHQHTDGKMVDLSELSRLAPLLGCNDPAAAFAADADATAEARRLLDDLAKERVAAREAAEAALEADAEVWQLRRRVAELEQLLALPPIVAYGVSVLQQKLRAVHAGSPRMFVEVAAAESATPGTDVSLESAWHTHRGNRLLATSHVPQAEFVLDDEED